MLGFVLAKKTYALQLQYRATHTLKMLASAVIGFLYASIWLGIGQDHTLDGYTLTQMFSYIAFNQAMLWVVGGVSSSLGLEASVRTGQIALELMRPVHLFYALASKECGHLAYQFVYKSVPILVIYSITMSMYVPKRPESYGLLAASLLLAAYLSFCMQYLTGIAALWTVESRWLGWLNFSIYSLLSGFFIPVEWLPGTLQAIAKWSPYPYLQYVPTSFYLEKQAASSLIGSVAWCAAFTMLCFGATELARRKVDIHGG